MPYLIRQLEITAGLPSIEVPGGVTGLALILRRDDRPVGFLMRSVPAGSVVSRECLLDWMRKDAIDDILADSIRQEIAGLPQHAEFSLTIAICTKDRADYVERCLASLFHMRGQGTPATSPIEILVVDNAPSQDETRRLVERVEGVRYTCEPRPGLDFARNRAVREASGQWVAFLDDDVIVDRSWLEGLRYARTDHPDAEAFTGPVLPFELATDAQVLFEQRGGFRRGFQRIRHTQSAPRSPLTPCNAGVFGAGCNMVFRREALLRLGGFDEALDTGKPLPGGGDLDIFYRIVRSGYPLAYEPYMTVYHQHRREYKKLRHQMWTWGLGMMAFVSKSFRQDRAMRRTFLLLVAGWMLYMTRMLFQTILGRNRHPWKADLALAELAGGVAGLCGEYGRSVRRIRAINKKVSYVVQ